jgi:hypothetical protein
MSHFSLKSLAFYATAIGSVLLLFNRVTAYGESNLKPPKDINGRYRLEFAQNLPGCEKSDSFLLNIQQSGVYVNASVLAMDTDHEVSSKRTLPTLSGSLNSQESSQKISQKLNLQGKAPISALCNIKDEKSRKETASVVVEMGLQSEKPNTQVSTAVASQLNGQLILEKSAQPIPFKATIEKSQEQSGKSNSH